MKTYVTLPVLAMFAFSFPLLADKKSVDCNKGQNLNKAVQSLSSGDTLTFTGTCNENVTIVTSGITITGTGTAVIQSPSPTNDTLTIIGEQRVTLSNFSVQNGNFGLHAGGNASVTLQSIVAQNNAQTGIFVEGGSSAYLTNCTSQNNAFDGVDAENSSSLNFSGTFVAQSNGVFGINLGVSSSGTLGAGTITAQQNTLGIQVSIDSSFFLGSPAATVKTLNNATVGLTVVSGAHFFSFGGSIVTSGNGLDGIDLASRAGMDFDAATQVSTFNNGRDGLHLEELSMVNLFNNPMFSGVPGNTTVQTYNNTSNGVALLNNSQVHMFDQAQIQSHNNTLAGIEVDDGSSLLLINSTVQNNAGGDVTLTFGSRGDFSKNTIGTLSCDATALIRGDTGKTCPAPLHH
jgi:hypothetical protein